MGSWRFDWDRANWIKCQKHGVSIDDIESLFDRPLAILPDQTHSDHERRLRAVGWTREGRAIFVVYTVRSHGNDPRIRPISARYMHAKEIAIYEKENPDIQKR